MSEIVHNSSAREGNTDPLSSQGNAYGSWCFTLHNWCKEDISKLLVKLDSKDSPNSSYIFSEELGKSGKTPHLQGYVELKKRKRLTAMVRWFNDLSNKASFRKANGSLEQNIEYITKEGGNVYDNCRPEYIYREEPTEKLKFLVKLIDEYSYPKGDRLVHVVVDRVGNLGKTEFARWCELTYQRCIITGGKAADMKNQVVEYYKKNKKHPKIVIIDIPRHTLGYVSYTGLEEIKNMLFYSGKYEGGMINGNKPFVLMLMNEYPTTEWLSADRWKIYELNREG